MTRPRPVPPAAPAHATSEAASGQAFHKVLEGVGSSAERSVMFEDSMKNIRACKALGLKTVFIDESLGADVGGEAALLGDTRAAGDDGAIDATIRKIADLKAGVPGLWEKRL